MSVLERAAYLELTTLLGNHLLAAQADRVGMAHGIEGRFPFLDHRVFAHSVATRPRDKIAGLHEKIAIRRVAAEVVPPIVAQRPEAALPRPRGRGVLRRRARVGDGAPLARGRPRRRDLRRARGGGARAALPRRPRDGLPREHGADGRALDPDLARGVLHRRHELPRGDRGAARAPPPRTTRTGG